MADTVAARWTSDEAPVASHGVIGTDVPRVEGVAKVTGAALYGADHAPPGLAHAAFTLSRVARGRVAAIDRRRAQALPGVLLILTHDDVGDAIQGTRTTLDDGPTTTTVVPLATSCIHFAGQIVAIAVAETIEAAREAAASIDITYEVQQPVADFDSPGAHEVDARAAGEASIAVGDVERGLAEAAFAIDVRYSTPAQHHNAMELFQATCAWSGDELTVWESSQNVRGFQCGLAEQLQMPAGKVRVLSQVVGGAFGSRGELGQMTAIVALAAKRVGRPVKLVASRRQGFSLRTYRAETHHRIRLGCCRDGSLTALSHDAWELTARTDRFALAGSQDSARLYACPNVHTTTTNVEADRQAAGFMRAPPEVPALFAMECAMDELAHAAGIDPLDLRRRNDAMCEPIRGLPYTSRSLIQCIDAGAAAFGWAARLPRPGTMRDGNELVGYGYATAFRPAQTGPAEARLTLTPNLRVQVEVGTHEIGTGITTVVAQTAADRLGLPLAAIEVLTGDSRLPAAPMSSGSNSTATVCNVVAKACDALLARIGHRGEAGESLAEAVRRAGGGAPLVEEASTSPHGVPPNGLEAVRRGSPIFPGGAKMKDRVQFAFGAHFVEVRVDRMTGTIRVLRMVGAFAAGRIMNPRTARSQLMGGQVWGLSAALLEATEIDQRTARYVNDNLGEYLVPVNADIGRIETIFVPEDDDLVNPLGIKGIGELGMTGVNAAVANAIFHATAVRVRDLPIRVEHLLGRGALL